MPKRNGTGLSHILNLPTLEAAKRLLGAKLVTEASGKRTSGMIVELEAYIGAVDQAAHCYRRRTKRTEIMYAESGHCYVYLIYGMHYCVNIVTEKKDCGAAVLIRALEPLEGIELMKKRRGYKQGKIYTLTNGPAKLCQAMAINPSHLGEHYLRSKRIRLEEYKHFKNNEIAVSTRIGITKSKDLPWRFYLKDNPWVSRGP